LEFGHILVLGVSKKIAKKNPEMLSFDYKNYKTTANGHKIFDVMETAK